MAVRNDRDTVSGTEFAKVKDENTRLRRRVRDLEYNAKRVRPKQIPDQAVQAVGELPAWLQEAVTDVVTDRSMRGVVMEVLERRSEFRFEHIALLAAIGMDRRAMEHVNPKLDKHWANKDNRDQGAYNGYRYQTIIVGGGLHAAIYAGVLAKMGGTRPLVIEKSRVGGVFACSKGPAFFLNSPNRGGPSSIPGQYGSLNYLPGCDLQPSDLDGVEYQTNDMLAWAIRANLALNADVWVQEVGSIRSRILYDTKGRQFASTNGRMIIANGLGKERRQFDIKSDRYVSFTEFMAMMEKPFPMRGLRRVCVLGGGDSGKCAVEALVGQGPRMLTTATLDNPAISWYGVREGCRTREEWTNTSRPRYKALGRVLKRAESVTPGRVRLRGRASNYRAQTCSLGAECVYVDGEPYDLVIDCTGWETPTNQLGVTPASSRTDPSGSQWGGTISYGFVVGAAATPFISPSDIDQRAFRRINENKTSIFYLAKKTEGVAMRLETGQPF